MILPGCDLTRAITSATELALTDGCSTSTLFSETRAATGARSLFGSNGIFEYSAGLIALMPLVVMKRV